MIGFSLRVLQTPSQLTVIFPIDPFLVLAWLIFFSFFLARFISGKSHWSTGGTIIRVVFFVIALGFVLSHGKMTMDAQSRTARIENTFIFHKSLRAVSLSEIDHATVATAPACSSYRLILRNGETIPLSFFNQQFGKQAAVNATNAFLDQYDDGADELVH